MGCENTEVDQVVEDWILNGMDLLRLNGEDYQKAILGDMKLELSLGSLRVLILGSLF